MASRPELIQCCDELDIDHKGKSIDEMKQLIREFADKNFKRRSKISGSKMSLTLRKFLSKEYDFKFYNKNKEEVNYKGNKI
uniref:Uncharacterized protein n=1 Tax=viral metagenome TaxID=1070528 RepID=A0A6M3Y054_9ZZZZ